MTIMVKPTMHSNGYLAFFRFIVDFPWPVVAIVVAITLYFSLSLRGLDINASGYFLDRSHPSRSNEAHIKSIFTNSWEQAFIVLVNQKDTVFDPIFLQTIYDLNQQFEDMTIVDDTDIKFVASLAFDDTSQTLINTILSDQKIDIYDRDNVKQLLLYLLPKPHFQQDQKQHLEQVQLRMIPVRNTKSFASVESLQNSDDDLVIDTLMPQTPTNEQQLTEFKQRVASNPLLNDILLSRSQRATTIQLELNIPEYDSPNMIRVHSAIKKILDQNIKPHQDYYLSGAPIVLVQLASTIQSDNQFFFPFVLIIISTILFICFKHIQGVLIPLVIATLTIIWTLGVMVNWGIKLNIVTTVLPIFLMTVAVADSIHFLNTYYQRLTQESAKDSAINTLQHLMTPLTLTSITTMGGFLALAFTDLIFVQEFGILMAIGVIFAYLLTIILLPTLLPLLKYDTQSTKQYAHSPLMRLVDTISVKTHSLLVHFPKLIIVAMAILAILAISSYQYIQVDQENIAYFDQDQRIQQDDWVINAHLGGTVPLDIWLTSDQERSFTDPKVIKAIEKIEIFLLEQDLVGYTLSPVGFLRWLHSVLNNEPHQLPDELSQELIAQYYFLYENSSGQNIRDVIDEDYSNARIIVLGNNDKGSRWSELINNTQAYAKTVLPEGISLHFNGYGAVLKGNIEAVISGLLTSIIIAVILISLIMIIVFRSVILGLIGMVPLVFTLLLNFYVMSLLNISLDIGTALTAGIAFGIGIDYSIHFLSLLKRFYNTPLPLAQSLTKTLNHVTRPIVVNSATLAAGFMVLTLSGFKALVAFGYLVAGTMFMCGLFALIILPILLSHIRPKALAKTVKP